MRDARSSYGVIRPVGIALLNYWFNIAGCHPAWCFTWFLIPIIGCLLMRLFPDKKPTEPARRSTASSAKSG